MKENIRQVYLSIYQEFDTADHDILMKKLELYGVQGNYLNWFKSCLTNRKQYIESKDFETRMLNIKCGVPQASILGPLLFIININDVFLSKSLLNLIMFAVDTNVFYSHQDVKELFRVVNSELKSKICDRLNATKLLLNKGKIKYTFFLDTEIGMIYL